MSDINFDAVYTAILSGSFDSSLDRFDIAIKERRKIVGLMNASKLKKGARVKLYGLSPKVLNDRVGEIASVPTGRGTKRFDVKLDHELVLRGRITDYIPGVPVDCIQPLEQEA
jgi:hypothetical protein